MTNQAITLWWNVISAVALAAPSILTPLLPPKYMAWMFAINLLVNIGLNTWRVQQNAIDAALIEGAPVAPSVIAKAVARIKSR